MTTGSDSWSSRSGLKTRYRLSVTESEKAAMLQVLG
jgi:hypothetical protein